MRDLKEFSSLMLLEQIPRRVGKLADNAPIYSKLVIDLIIEKVGRTPIGIDEIAQELDVPKRTLQRWLKGEGTTYLKLRDRARCQLAQGYLEVTKHTIHEIAEFLSFTNRTCFTSAFKRWSGRTPTSHRNTFSIEQVSRATETN